MSQMHLFKNVIWSVSQLTRYLRDIFESDPELQDIWVQGEISNFSRPNSGHLYFTLKDATGALRCVMWRNAAARLKINPYDGQAVEVHGSLNIYEAAGQYQLYADLIHPLGEGRLYLEFLHLKAKLEAEGLFDPERKRPIPETPRRIGIVTSATGAALQDMLHTLQRRFPIAEVILAPTAVQGEDAPPGIRAALASLNAMDPSPDIILLARGGGSMEDLWAFNDEQVARAIAASSIPVIAGIGHETDFTIADFVADLRAPTPTAAAELATPDRTELLSSLIDYTRRLKRSVTSMIDSQRWTLQDIHDRIVMRSPLTHVRTERQRLDDLSYRSELASRRFLQTQHSKLASSHGKLQSLNPFAVLQRGYAIVSKNHGELVRSTNQIHNGDRLDIQLHDGQFPAIVSESE